MYKKYKIWWSFSPYVAREWNVNLNHFPIPQNNHPLYNERCAMFARHREARKRIIIDCITIEAIHKQESGDDAGDEDGKSNING